MNGLDGPYTQILINSRPVFSALAGVYGLDMVPVNMVDRIEVVRGGGSVMFGGNAIAGTVNIITKDPVENSFEVGVNQSFINGEASDRTVNFNGTIVADDLSSGVTLYGFNRNRDHWDANGDGFSEIVELANNTFGFDAFYNFTDRNRIELGAYYVDEYRRGGNKFDLAPHQTDITEQLEHNILSTNLAYEHFSRDFKHKFTLYGSLQHINRDSYYGGGGRVLTPADTILTQDDIIAINAYGSSEDISTVTGLQYNYEINPIFTLTAGSEYIYNDVIDEMPGYGRVIDQQVATWGTFAELEVKPTDRLTFLLGGRIDQLNIDGRYDLEGESYLNEENIGVFVPRISAMYELRENLKLRASYAQGYRGPQAFDEDLHIETVGGAARFIQLDPNLEVETSNSAVLSLNYDKFTGENQMSFVVEGFYTQLDNPFVLSDQQELPNGVAVITKRNGDAATVSGVNLEANIAFGNTLILQSGATFQRAVYETPEEIWSPEAGDAGEAAVTERLLRTPNAYGYFSLVYYPISDFALSYSGVITGAMDVAHVINADTEETIIERTPSFFENNVKIAYTLRPDENYSVELYGGIQNVFDSFQEDFDLGAERDAGYVYGPIRPRTFFMGVKFGLN
jgi:outer membrane receptor for ferrienterochelin and colicins